MKQTWKMSACLVALLFFALAVRAQEKPAAAEEATDTTALKAQIVLSEYDGAKKVANLPYVLPVAPKTPRQYGSVRAGVRVPVSLESKDAKYSYIDVGTNLDCAAEKMADGRYKLSVVLERSSVYAQVGQNKAVEWAPGEERPGTLPLVRSFRTQFDVLVRDGQTVEGATATDPLSGHVLKVEVTLNAMK